MFMILTIKVVAFFLGHPVYAGQYALLPKAQGDFLFKADKDYLNNDIYTGL